MKCRNFIGLALAICVASTSVAQSPERIYLKDTSYLNGFICEQEPGKSFKVQADSAMFVVSTDSLKLSTETIFAVDSLPDDWKQWLEANGIKTDKFKLSTLKFPSTEYSNVYKVSEGEKIKFLTVESRQYAYPWNVLEKTVKKQRPEGQLSGINDIVVMKDNVKYVGQVTEQCPGHTIKIQTSPTDATTIKSSEVKEMQTEALSDRYSIIDQSRLLDRIFTKNSMTPTEGLIISRRTGQDITIRTLNGDEYSIPTKDITRYEKFLNPGYKVLVDHPIKKGQFQVNGDSKNAWFAPLQTFNGYLVLDEEVSMALHLGDEIVLEANLDNPSALISIVKAYKKNIAKDNSWRQIVRYVFTWQNLFESALPFNRELTPLGNTKVTYTPKEAGDYVIAVQGESGFIVIHVD